MPEVDPDTALSYSNELRQHAVNLQQFILENRRLVAGQPEDQVSFGVGSEFNEQAESFDEQVEYAQAAIADVSDCLR